MTNRLQSSFLLCANWKMNKTPHQTKEYLEEFCRLVSKEDQKHFVFFAPAITLLQVKTALKSTDLGWGGQNCYFEDKGAFTGENSPLVLSQIGANYCLVGHSERRQLFFEDNQTIQKKIKALWKHSIRPVLCIGETPEQKEKGQSLQVIQQQLNLVLESLKSHALTNQSTNLNKTANRHPLIVAYEPVWAVGSGQIASPSHIQKIRDHTYQMCSATQQPILFLYGGSVNINNIQKLFNSCQLDGFLVGGASLNPNLFFELFSKLKPSFNPNI